MKDEEIPYEEGKTPIPNFFIDDGWLAKVNKHEMSMFYGLCRMTLGEQVREGKVSNEYFEKYWGMSKKNISKAADSLEKMGLIAVTRVESENIYRILIPNMKSE